MAKVIVEEKFGIYFWTDPDTGEVVSGRTEIEVRSKVIMYRIRKKRRR